MTERLQHCNHLGGVCVQSELAHLRAENVKLRAFVDVVRKRVPVARMRPDYSGLECVGCGAGPSAPCTEDCWVDAMNVAADACTLPSSRDPKEGGNAP